MERESALLSASSGSETLLVTAIKFVGIVVVTPVVSVTNGLGVCIQLLSNPNF
jgi:hypothetical protein